MHPTPSPPLLVAARDGDVASLQSLLQHGADVNMQDEEGSTALHWAADGNHVAAVRALLEHGADATVTDSQGDTALAVAMLCNHTDAVAALRYRNME